MGVGAVFGGSGRLRATPAATDPVDDGLGWGFGACGRLRAEDPVDSGGCWVGLFCVLTLSSM